MHIFVFIALSYSRASSLVACKATCKILFLYCVVQKGNPSLYGWVLTRWLNALSTMHYREDRLWWENLHLLNLVVTWRERLSRTLLDQWQWTTLKRHWEEQVKAHKFETWNVFDTWGAGGGRGKTNTGVWFFCRTEIVFTRGSKQPRYQVVKATINGWGDYFPCRFPSCAEITLNLLSQIA